MLDLVYLLVAGVFFLSCYGLIWLCLRLMEG
jgi:hypothetical protein